MKLEGPIVILVGLFLVIVLMHKVLFSSTISAANIKVHREGDVLD